MQQAEANMKKLLLALPLLVGLTGCASFSQMDKFVTGTQFQDPKVEGTILTEDKYEVPKPKSGPVAVAVYSFIDRTGQRKPNPQVAQLSSAVTQGAETYLIKALQDAGSGQWFKVVERVGLDNLMKERQMIRQMREIYDGENAKPLPPMLFAGILIEGGIVGYDSNIVTGGAGMRMFGIGPQTQYQADMITVSLRVVSVTTGEVLLSVLQTKTVYSYMDKLGVLKFYDAGTNSVEAEIGRGLNESVNRATNMAVQAAVVQLIREGEKKGFWEYDPVSAQELADKQQEREDKKLINRIKNAVKKDDTEVEQPLETTPTTVNTGDEQKNKIDGDINEQRD